jgi:hypothetical protein
VANGWAESRWRLRTLCDLPRRFEMCYSAGNKDGRMFDDRLHEMHHRHCWARGGREVDERAVSGRGGFLAAFSKESIGATTPSTGTQDVS